MIGMDWCVAKDQFVLIEVQTMIELVVIKPNWLVLMTTKID